VLVVSSSRGDVRGFPAALQTWRRVLLGVLLYQNVLLRHLVPLPEVDSVLSSRCLEGILVGPLPRDDGVAGEDVFDAVSFTKECGP
jgi:hypothetical protein